LTSCSTIFIKNEPLKALTIQEKVSVGREYSLALKKDGTVWSWGENSSGQLGINNTTDQSTPVQVVGESGVGFLENIIDISAGTDHSIALQDDGTIWVWGENADGQLGNGGTTDKITPIKVTGITNVIEISAGWGYTHIVKSDGSIWSWGSGSSGELGIGTTTQSSIPVQVKGVGGTGFLGNIIDVSTGEQHILALKNDGTVYSWGSGGSGRLGNNASTNRNTPVKVVNETNTGDLLNIQKISAGYNHSMALAQDGSLYVWGNNDAGQLGIGT
jgi:alpha-tubulin suppressor-like RCC1 family protein